MIIETIISLIVVSAIGGIVLLLIQVGKEKERYDAIKKQLDIIDEQAKIAVNRPNATELIDRLRGNRF